MKRILLLISLLILTITTQSQEKLNYKINGKTVEFNISRKEMYVKFSRNQRSIIKKLAKKGYISLTDSSALLETQNISGTFISRKQNLKSRFNITFKQIEPVLIYKDGIRQIAIGELNIQLKTDIPLNEILKGYNYKSEANTFVKNQFIVKLDLNTSELFKLVNRLQNDDRIIFVEPNFVRMLKTHTNDPLFNSQWAINNQGYQGGILDADMDIDDAWSYTTGSGIKVAIIDTGVDLNHQDLQGNLLTGYDATGGNSNGNQTGNAHGTVCAGIVAAIANNSTGITGVAYGAKIIPVKVFPSSGSPTDNMLANGINWAWQNGADILSNSWGGGSPSNTISNAITNAVNNGRNGKGAIVLFSSGNNNGKVSFPATLDNVIAVGASSMCDERKSPTSCDGESWWGSNFGNEIDVVAPGVKIYTTDISGSTGYSLGDYLSNFNGTSSACPNVAGVVALILSINPNLTQQETTALLEKNTDKVNGYNYSSTSNHPNGTWNNEMGYGRVNARKAVESVIFSNVKLSGTNTICNSNSLFSLSQVPNGMSVNWTVSSNLQIINSSNTNVTVIPVNSLENGTGYIKAIIGNKIIQKNVWIGTPKITVQLVPQGSNSVMVNLIGTNNTDINSQGITATTWQKVSSSGGCYASFGGSGFEGLAQGNCNNWSVEAKITATNSCGTTTIYKTITPPPPVPCNNSFSFSQNPMKAGMSINKIIIDPCLTNSTKNSTAKINNYTITIYNKYGEGVYLKTQKDTKFLIQNLKKGFYIVRFTTNSGKIISKKLIVE